MINLEKQLPQPYHIFTEQLLHQGKLSESDLHKAKRVQQTTDNDTLPNLLVKLGLCSEQDVANALTISCQLPIVEKTAYPDESPLPDSVSLRFLKQYHLIGLSTTSEEIVIAVSDPEERFITDSLALATNKKIIAKIGLPSEINTALEKQYGEGKSQMDLAVSHLADGDIAEDDLEHLKDLASEAPVIKMVNLIMQKAIETGASDIHIEPFEQRLIVRLRMDGVLQNIDAPPVSSIAAVISRIKIMAKLNIAERRLPQDGRIKLQMLGKELDLRVSTVPTMYGESIVIRLLDQENTVLDFQALGFTGKPLENFTDILNRPHGIILITGPTGSGKSTSLYAALTQLNTASRKIITVEDPVEYQLEGINQIQVKPQIELTFAKALRSIVRQDPDVIMIGEMRDLETAKIAVQSALTGHLVLSTLHTNNAAGGVTRLLDMGLEEYLLTSTVNGILAQRLVRKLCEHCKQVYQPTTEIIESMRLKRFSANSDITLHKAKGCEQCGGIGYQGRLAILEFLPMNDDIRRLIMARKEAGEIHKLAIKQGMLTMTDDGFMKALKGLTTLEEVMRVTTES
jgi:general secretion pathway protein E